MHRTHCLLMLCLLPLAVRESGTEVTDEQNAPFRGCRSLASRCHSAMDGASNWVQNLRQSSRLNRMRHGQPSACPTPGIGWATTRTHPRPTSTPRRTW